MDRKPPRSRVTVLRCDRYFRRPPFGPSLVASGYGLLPLRVLSPLQQESTQPGCAAAETAAIARLLMATYSSWWPLEREIECRLNKRFAGAGYIKVGVERLPY